MIKFISSLFLFMLCLNVYAGKTYTWEIIRIIDGDTFEVREKFFPEELGTIKVRIAGIDTPEKNPRAKCQSEHELALKAEKYAKKELLGKMVLITNIKQDKYGSRLVADVYLHYGSFADSMIKLGLAREYDGRTKKSWCSK